MSLAADGRNGGNPGAVVVESDLAFTEVWCRSAPVVLKNARRVLGSMTEAEDIAQDVFCQVFRKAKTLRPPESPCSFVPAFANHVLESELRRRKRRRALLPLPLGAKNLKDLEDPRAADIESRDLLRRFDALLDRLNPRHRRVFVLRKIEAMTIEEVAAVTRLSTSTVKRALAYTFRRISCWVDADPGLASALRMRPGMAIL
jgi:RNA polymerase sigma-70 factor (ECF subfamily)